ncbi:MAG: PilZ domain-containing protein [Thermodesulfobacteriota bacterium]
MEALVGKNALRFLREILLRKTQLSLFIPGADYTRLTIILKLPVIGDQQYVAMDWIEDFTDTIISNPDPKLIFECIDNQKIPYRFRAKLYKAEGREIWVYFPKEIVRIQRRRHFRIDVPSGSEVSMSPGGETSIFAIKDISVSGLAILVPRNKGKEKFLKPGDELKDLRVHLLLEGKVYGIDVKSAIVRRLQDNMETNVILCGLEFTGIDNKTENIVNDYIRRLERSMLRKLRGIED